TRIRRHGQAASMTDRLPPGQVLTTKWPVLHYGDVPAAETRTWSFEVSGLVERPFTLTYDELLQLPRKTVRCDIHCVTRCSRLDLVGEDIPGFWEQNGYHMRGDPWREERYGGRALTQHEINRLRNRSKKGV